MNSNIPENYDSLPEHEKIILHLLAFFMTPIVRTPFIECLKQYGVRITPTRSTITVPEITEILEHLVQAKLAVKATIIRENCYLVAPQLQNDLIALAAEKEILQKLIEAVKPQIYNSYYRSGREAVQALRLAIYDHNPSKLQQAYKSVQQLELYDKKTSAYSTVFIEPLKKQWFKPMPQSLRNEILSCLASDTFWNLETGNIFSIISEEVAEHSEKTDYLLFENCFYTLLTGDIRKASQLLELPDLRESLALRGVMSVMQGDTTRAIDYFEEQLVLYKKNTRKKKAVLPELYGLLHILSLISCNTPSDISKATEYIDISRGYSNEAINPSIQMLYHMLMAMKKNKNSITVLINTFNRAEIKEPFAILTGCLIASKLKFNLWSDGVMMLKQLLEKAKQAGFLWIAAEALYALKQYYPKYSCNDTQLEKLYADNKLQPFFSADTKDENSWQRSIKALLEFGAKTTVQTNSLNRLIWIISKESPFIQPMEQKYGVKGWSKGRNIALKRLHDDVDRIEHLTRHDKAVIAYLRKEQYYNFGHYSSGYEFDTFKGLQALAGHPFLFNSSLESMTIEQGQFNLSIIKKGQQLTAKFTPELQAGTEPFWKWKTPNRLYLYSPTSEQCSIAKILGAGITIPLSAEQQLTEAVTAIAPHVMIQSDLVTTNELAETVEADSRLHIMLRPSGSGITAELRIYPFGEKGPMFRAGQGGSTLITEIDGKKKQCLRNISQEKKLYRQLLSKCSSFDTHENENDCWRLESAEDSLVLMEELQMMLNAAPDSFVLHWPEGEQFKLKGSVTWGQMKLNISSGKDWFSLEGNLAVDEKQMLSLQKLLELSSMQHGRFIEVAKGEFLAMTEELRRKLEELRRLTERHGKEQLRIQYLAGALLDETLNGAGSVSGDKNWQRFMERFNSANALKPLLPATLQTELREYQLEGFRWLCRLAHWGVGACLADDMGLGKTIQALALLLTRAPDGPALVLAPTSVCFNWESEACRFAPTLSPKLFGKGDRKQFMESLQPFDLVICSYTMFQQEAELLTSQQWETVVLDEAQAIKNMTTKRSQAAMQLKANFRIATTGTPVENRLDELWNLFRFLNPGLLGSHQSFNVRFAIPVERDNDKSARNLLRKMIRPFILRRTKSQVLEELPPRTEIVQRIELSIEETALYEALRRTALEHLEKSDNQEAGERHLRILAEIMKLRRACCHPQLVMPDCGINGSKLAAFLEIVQELRENGHRALVFSQFVDHLAILRNSLDKQKISYQYLDGSTSQKDRQQRVNAFQAGQGELFLISLKAGGTGLNLTAADYVIHVDPWWNPAVEDQASDRAHRIGQTRPVTVYRLVTANTIEEKITALHSRKRELADSLLEGTDTAARISAEELLVLLKDAG